MIENCTITNLDSEGGTIIITETGDVGQPYTFGYLTEEALKTSRRWSAPDCRWLPEPVEVVR